MIASAMLHGSPSMLLCTAAVAVLVVYWHLRRVREVLARWAALHHFKVLDYSRLFLPPWPPAIVLVSTSKSQVLLRVRVYDERIHRIRHGWVRLGSWWWGLLDEDAVEAFWADE